MTVAGGSGAAPTAIAGRHTLAARRDDLYETPVCAVALPAWRAP
jgi:hypothetical protein